MTNFISEMIDSILGQTPGKEFSDYQCQDIDRHPAPALQLGEGKMKSPDHLSILNRKQLLSERKPRHQRPKPLLSMIGPVLCSVTIVLMTGASAGAGMAAGVSLSIVPAVFVNISATSGLSFAPTQVTVTPGASVHLTVTQLANFAHTFTLSSVANFTIPIGDSSSQLAAFFNAHPPLVNLSLGSTPGGKYFANFSAPAQGSYEFVCLIHFSQGMVGTLSSGTSSTGSGSGSSFPTSLVVVIVVVLAAVAAASALILARRRPPKPTAPEPPPAPRP
jgi:plastocyanin